MAQKKFIIDGGFETVGNSTVNGSLDVTGDISIGGVTAATQSYVDTAVSNVSVDLTGYATEAYATQAKNDAIASATAYTDSSINTMLSTTSSAVTSVESDLATEATARASADLDLQGNIDAEAVARTLGDEGTLVDAKAYTDTRETAITTAYQSYADTAEADAITAAKNYTDTSVANLVDTAPATLDTLNELAAALGDDPNFATTVSNSIGTKWTQDNAKITNWDTAYGWGNHAGNGYVSTYDNTPLTLERQVTVSNGYHLTVDSGNFYVNNGQVIVTNGVSAGSVYGTEVSGDEIIAGPTGITSNGPVYARDYSDIYTDAGNIYTTHGNITTTNGSFIGDGSQLTNVLKNNTSDTFNGGMLTIQNSMEFGPAGAIEGEVNLNTGYDITSSIDYLVSNGGLVENVNSLIPFGFTAEIAYEIAGFDAFFQPFYNYFAKLTKTADANYSESVAFVRMITTAGDFTVSVNGFDNQNASADIRELVGSGQSITSVVVVLSDGSVTSVTANLVTPVDPKLSITTGGGTAAEITSTSTGEVVTSGGLNVNGTATATSFVGDGSQLEGLIRYYEQSAAPVLADGVSAGDIWKDTDTGVLYMAAVDTGVLSWFEV